MFANVASAFGFGTSSSSTAKPKDEGTFEARPKDEETLKGRKVIENLADATLESMNHYEVLGLHWEASKTEIIRAYREMARMWYLNFSLRKFLTSGTGVLNHNYTFQISGTPINSILLTGTCALAASSASRLLTSV